MQDCRCFIQKSDVNSYPDFGIDEFSLFKYAPATSVEVERSFSQFKAF